MNGIIQRYWAALPSTKPWVEAGVELGPRSVGIAVLDVSSFGGGLRVEDVLPILGALEEEAVVGAVAHAARELGEGEVGGGVFEGVGGGSPGVGADRDVVELEPEIERGSLADALDGAALFAEVMCGGNGGRVEERFVGGACVEVFAAEGKDGGDGRRRGVAVHDVRDAGVVGPAVPLASVLVGLVEE